MLLLDAARHAIFVCARPRAPLAAARTRPRRTPHHHHAPAETNVYCQYAALRESRIIRGTCVGGVVRFHYRGTMWVAALALTVHLPLHLSRAPSVLHHPAGYGGDGSGRQAKRANVAQWHTAAVLDPAADITQLLRRSLQERACSPASEAK